MKFYKFLDKNDITLEMSYFSKLNNKKLNSFKRYHILYSILIVRFIFKIKKLLKNKQKYIVKFCN